MNYRAGAGLSQMPEGSGRANPAEPGPLAQAISHTRNTVDELHERIGALEAKCSPARRPVPAIAAGTAEKGSLCSGAPMTDSVATVVVQIQCAIQRINALREELDL